MNKRNIIEILVIIGVIVVLAIASWGSPKPLQVATNNQKADKIEVFLFHATQRCPTCIRIGQLAKATLEERFPEQLKSGKIYFREINIDFPENKALAEKFQATGSALFINAIRNGQDNIKEDTMVWQLASGDSVKYKDYLANKLNNILGI
ncbi:MAG: nitrophenyl compound nitroreductase subunit ArsF family protein [Candidatus Gribaldobacteria bacterium]|nr:nitrophenyl compound nitroreductase subunit ArsF family protein [Candidatus Gribaldobacteria bacterium]